MSRCPIKAAPAFALSWLLLASAANAQTTDTIEPDRPDVTNGTHIVDNGLVQIEFGGIYTRNSGLSYTKVPWFADIPILGWLFKNRRENDDRTELLIFITPRIVNCASAHR